MTGVQTCALPISGSCYAWPIFGHRLQNYAYYVSINRKGDLMIHDYDVSNLKKPTDEDFSFKSVYRSNPDKNIWMDNLRQQQTDYLFIYYDTTLDQWPIEYTWAIENPLVFKEMCRSKQAVIFKINL